MNDDAKELPAVQQIRVLILADDLNFGQMLLNDLRRSSKPTCIGLAVSRAEESYIALVNAPDPIDILLVDMQSVSEIDGLVVLQELLRLSPQSDAIAFVPAGDRETGLRSYRAGATYYLQKPLDLDELIWVLSTIQEQRRARLQRDRFERQLQTTIEFNEHLASTLDLASNLNSILQSLRNLFPQVYPILLAYDRHTDQLYSSVSTRKFLEGMDSSVWEQIAALRIALDDSHNIAAVVAREALETRHFASIQVGRLNNPYNLTPLVDTPRSELAIGLVDSTGQLLGVLVLHHDSIAPFSKEEIALLRGAAAPAISLALERAAHTQELRFLSSVATATAWAAEIAHDVNNEIGLIRSQSYLLQHQLPEAQQKGIKRIVEATQQLASYVNAPNMTQETLSLNHWLSTAVESLGTAVRPKVKFCFDLQAGDVKVFASTLLLERALRHLIRNAIKAMDGQGLLTLRSRREGNLVEIQISNSGPTIPPELRSKLFVEQITDSTHPEGRSGLGLLFTRAAIESMGGEVYVLAAEPEVTFAFRLRIAEPPANVLQGLS